MGYLDFKEMLTDAKNLATGANDLQLKSILLDIQGAVYDLQEENRTLRDKIRDLENERITESDLTYNNGYYVRNTDNRKICSRCWDEKKKEISLLETEIGEYCPVCEVYY